MTTTSCLIDLLKVPWYNYLWLRSNPPPFDLKMTICGARKEGGGLLESVLNETPLFFGAGLLAEVPESLLGSIKTPSFPMVL